MTTHPYRRIAYVGNFRPPHSTENHVAETLRRMGHEVVPLQEDDPATWRWLNDENLPTVSMVLWTRTGWDPPVPDEQQRQMIDGCRELGVPTVGFHLDRWFGLAREAQVDEQPFFRCDLVCTADGGHDADWLEHGVNHLWLPPAVAEWQCGWGTPRPEFLCDVAFVGSWESYHPEWTWRTQMVRQLRNRYGARRMRCWPEPGKPAVRGAALRDLYASAKVVVGDSCLAGGVTHYWSDRVPETLGRGGLLVHPVVDGMRQQGLRPGQHYIGVEPESITAMFTAVDWALAMPIVERIETQRDGMAEVMARHTYRNRMETLLDAVDALAVAA